jgi:hypothetical protein
MTSYNEIKKWYNEGKKAKYKYMTVICDTFDWEDYPSYGDSPKVAGNMEKVMEVYDLSRPFETQNGNEKYKTNRKIMQRIEISVQDNGKVYKMLIDCEPKNYNRKALEDFAKFCEYKIKDFILRVK